MEILPKKSNRWGCMSRIHSVDSVSCFTTSYTRCALSIKSDNIWVGTAVFNFGSKDKLYDVLLRFIPCFLSEGGSIKGWLNGEGKGEWLSWPHSLFNSTNTRRAHTFTGLIFFRFNRLFRTLMRKISNVWSWEKFRQYS